MLEHRSPHAVCMRCMCTLTGALHLCTSVATILRLSFPCGIILPALCSVLHAGRLQVCSHAGRIHSMGESYTALCSHPPTPIPHQPDEHTYTTFKLESLSSLTGLAMLIPYNLLSEQLALSLFIAWWWFAGDVNVVHELLLTLRSCCAASSCSGPAVHSG